MRKGILHEFWCYGNGTEAEQKSRQESRWRGNLSVPDQEERSSFVIDADKRVAQLKSNFPRVGSYVFTHGDLHPDNIFISNDNEEKMWKVSAILDWELAGFFPWWAETIRANFPESCEELGVADDSNFFFPEHSTEEWESIWERVSPVLNLWENGGAHDFCKHGLGEVNRWYSKPFCACKPYVYHIRDSNLGELQEHTDVVDVDSTDSEWENDPDKWQKFESHDLREFVRWFKEINSEKTGDTDLAIRLHS